MAQAKGYIFRGKESRSDTERGRRSACSSLSRDRRSHAAEAEITVLIDAAATVRRTSMALRAMGAEKATDFAESA